jgi:hypothetical protein
MQHALRELSVVCVTSGERSRLTFDDVTPILERHGADALRSLELKVWPVCVLCATFTSGRFALSDPFKTGKRKCDQAQFPALGNGILNL